MCLSELVLPSGHEVVRSSSINVRSMTVLFPFTVRTASAGFPNWESDGRQGFGKAKPAVIC
jgi:hypothetical protein